MTQTQQVSPSTLSPQARRLAVLLQRGFALYYGWSGADWYAMRFSEGEAESRVVRRDDAHALRDAGLIYEGRYDGNGRDTYQLAQAGRLITMPPWRPTKAQRTVLERMRAGDLVEKMGRSYYFVEGMRLSTQVTRVLFEALIDAGVVERTNPSDALRHARWAATPVRAFTISGVPVNTPQEGYQLLEEQISAVAPLEGQIVSDLRTGAFVGALIDSRDSREVETQLALRLRDALPDRDWTPLHIEVALGPA